MDGERAVSTRYELRPAHEDTRGDARDRELEPLKSAISGRSTQGVGETASAVFTRITALSTEHWIGSIQHGTGPLDRLALPHWCVTALLLRRKYEKGGPGDGVRLPAGLEGPRAGGWRGGTLTVSRLEVPRQAWTKIDSGGE